MIRLIDQCVKGFASLHPNVIRYVNSLRLDEIYIIVPSCLLTRIFT